MKLKLLKEQRGSGMCVCLDSTRITNQKIYGFLDTVREWEVDPKQIAGIIGYPQVQMSEWISCEEELPEALSYVLAVEYSKDIPTICVAYLGDKGQWFEAEEDAPIFPRYWAQVSPPPRE